LLTETAEGYCVEKQAQLMSETSDSEPAIEPAIEHPNILSENTKVRFELKTEAWYKYLICLCYGISVQFAVALLYSFPATGGTANLSSGVGFRGIVKDSFVWTVPNLVIILVSNLVFLDKDLQRLWKSSKLGRLMCTSQWARLGWVFVVLFLFFLSAGIEVALYFVNMYLWLDGQSHSAARVPAIY
jgi:hypothetical protein